jgi:hypothetical protein
MRCSILAFAVLLTVAALARAAERPTVLVVVGADGTPEYGQQFREWAHRWEAAANKASANWKAIGLDAETKATDREQLQQFLAAQQGRSPEALWLVLIGHGTFDGKTARFNLRGPDVSAADLADWLKPLERPLAIIDCSSSSGPFLQEISGPGRVVVVSTKSGHEQNFARFGDYFSAAIANPKADLDKDEQTSLLEAFLLASAGTAEFYTSDGRLLTEHALLDDNGDRLGTPPDWFHGVRATKVAKAGAAVDGTRAHQLPLVRSGREEQLTAEARQERDGLEQQLEQLRARKSQLAEDEYYGQLEPLLVRLAKLYQQAEQSDE